MNIEDRILYEDNHIIAVNKLPGEIVQGDKTEDIPLLEIVKQYIKEKYHKPGNVFLSVVHRIDRPVSGVVLFARTSKMAAKLSELIRNGQILKSYWAVTCQKPDPPSGTLIDYLYRNEKQNKTFIVKDTSKYVNNNNVKLLRAKLNYCYLTSNDNYYLVEIELITGRHHQIRAQMANIGCPIKGDLKYGAPRSNKDGSISLYACKVEFVHPTTGESIVITAPKPDTDSIWSTFNY